MIKTFSSQGAADIFLGLRTKAALKTLPRELGEGARGLLNQLDSAPDVSFMGFPKGNRLHKLKGDLKDYWSVSINESWRITFKFKDDKNAYEVTISKHYGD